MNTSRTNLNEYEWKKIYEDFQQENSRAAIIISAAFLDTLLRDLLASFMVDDRETVDKLLGNDNNLNAPLMNFASRVRCAYCIGLISIIQSDDLKVIGQIRNYFAHTLKVSSFDDNIITEKIDKLHTAKFGSSIIHNGLNSNRDKYLFSVSFLMQQLGIRILEVQKEQRKIYL